jgi:hypothetical protein
MTVAQEVGQLRGRKQNPLCLYRLDSLQQSPSNGVARPCYGHLYPGSTHEAAAALEQRSDRHLK